MWNAVIFLPLVMSTSFINVCLFFIFTLLETVSFIFVPFTKKESLQDESSDLKGPWWQKRRRYSCQWGWVQNRLHAKAHHPPLPRILLANVQLIDNKLGNIRVSTRYQLYQVHSRASQHSLLPILHSHGSFLQWLSWQFTYHPKDNNKVLSDLYNVLCSYQAKHPDTTLIMADI